ncbi:MAG: nitronate monooxygenase [Pseudomonadota bacterium]
MWPDRRICDLLGIEHPIIQAPMTGSCTPQLAAAVANAGGLGSMGCAGKSVEKIRQEVDALKAASNHGYNLNFFATEASRTDPATLAHTRERLQPWFEKYDLGPPPEEVPPVGPGFDAERLDLVLELRPRVVSFHFGQPDVETIALLKDADIILLSTATNVQEAKALEAAGMDAIIAQGWEAGGHRGSHTVTEPMQGVGTMALVPQIVDAVSVPIIAAGGIADGRGIAAAFALGASGVQLGTAFLSCPEAATDPTRRARLQNATDQDTMVTDAVSGRCARTARSNYAASMEAARAPLPGFRQLSALVEPLLKAADDDDASFHLYGQAAALNREMPAAELIDWLIDDTGKAIAKLSPR